MTSAVTPSAELQHNLRDRMTTSGPLPLTEVMAQAVQTYYAQGTAFGRQGDFTTAPEISQTFGEILGLWAAVVWQGLGMPQKVILAELGPGRGTLIADMVRTARAVPPFAEALDIHLVETSPSLRTMQKAALATYGKTAQWHDDFSTLPPGPMILVGNEFIDALPIEQWIYADHQWHLRMVDWDATAQAFSFCTGPTAQELGRDLEAFGPPFDAASRAKMANGTVAELCPAGLAVATALADRLAHTPGAAVLIDYGPGESAAGDSLQALKNHKFHPPLEDLGSVDLTAHVDFTRLCTAARSHGAYAYGPITQGRFLSGLGIEARANALMRKASSAKAMEIGHGVRRLINPSEMGTLFKVIALTDPSSPPPPGFEATSMSER